MRRCTYQIDCIWLLDESVPWGLAREAEQLYCGAIQYKYRHLVIQLKCIPCDQHPKACLHERCSQKIPAVSSVSLKRDGSANPKHQILIFSERRVVFISIFWHDFSGVLWGRMSSFKDDECGLRVCEPQQATALFHKTVPGAVPVHVSCARFLETLRWMESKHIHCFFTAIWLP